MKKHLIIVSVIISVLLLSSTLSFAQNNVEIKFNHGGDKLYIGENNRVEVWIQNENNLNSMSLGLEFAWDPALTMNFVTPYGDYSPPSYVNQENDAAYVWQLVYAADPFVDDISPDTIHIGGYSGPHPGLPADPIGRMCYTMMIYIPAGQPEVLDGFSVDNVFRPPGGGWIFNEGSGGFPPDFHGQANTSTSNPDAPAVFFDVVERPRNNVTVRFNGGGDELIIGENNIVEFWLQNENDLSGAISLGFEFAWDPSLTMNFVTSYGSFPAVPPGGEYLAEENDAIGVWNLGGLSASPQVLNGFSPVIVLFGGAALASTGLPADPIGRMCYSMMLYVPPDQVPISNGFSADNIFIPPGGGWIYNEGTGGYPPDFHGHSNTSTGNPDALAVFFDVICPDPVFTSTPPPLLQFNAYDNYSFQFEADYGASEGSVVTFSGDNVSPSGLFQTTVSGACQTVDYTVAATNECGSSVDYNFQIDWTNNTPVITNCSPSSAITWFWYDWSRDFDFTDADPNDTHTWSVQALGSEPVGTYSIDPITGFFNFSPSEYDGGITFDFEIKIEDSCGGEDICQIQIEICACGPLMIQVEKTHNTLQGHYEYVSINKLYGGELMGGFDFLIGYDASALTFVSAELGDLLDADGCGWEYFNYNPGAFGNCNGPCPSGKLRIVSIADQLNGANHPSCYSGNGELVSLKFFVTNDRTYECQYAPIKFCWEDCGDNAISSTSGDTLFISQEVYDFEWDGNFSNYDHNITGIDCPANGFHYGGACEDCDVSDKLAPVRFIWFWNGGVDIVCADSIDDVCDLNLNAIPYEIADAVEYTRYFLYGISIVSPSNQEAFIAASDCNKDGNPLSVGDLVHLLRVIVGDALPYNKRVPFAEEVEITTKAGQFVTESTSDIGALFAIYNISGDYQITNNTNMELISAEEDGNLRVLLYAGIDNPANYLSAGTNNIFTIEGHAVLVELQVSDYQGNLLETQIKKYSLPTDYLLHQNSPNPFNPTTKITFDLPEVTNWQITIYNVTGQQIESFSGQDIGSVIVEWNAEHTASGIYFYKATAGDFTQTKKMILMK